MLSALLATSLAFGTYHDPAADHGVARSSVLELLARVSDTRIVAVNPAPRPQLLVFADTTGDRSIEVLIPANGNFEADFPLGTLDDLDLTLVVRDDDGLRTTGALSLVDLVQRGFDLVWMESVRHQIHTFGDLPSGTAHIAAHRDARTGIAGLAHATQPAGPSAAHVPVITPTNKPKGDLPPRIEPKPLPPV